MKQLLFFLFLYYTLALGAKEPLKIGVITDTHYLSEKLMDEGSALQSYISSSGKNVSVMPAVLDKVLDDYLHSDIQILLISGDITKDGEKQSHIEFLQKLKPLQDKGIKVLVIPGNHDINMPNAVEFKGNDRLPTANISPTDFAQMYADCGYKDAISRDAASLSYVAALDEHTWLLAIDAARYKEYKTSSITGGKIPAETEKWIVDVLDQARQKHINVIGMMHWGLTEHIMSQSTFFKDYLVDDWQRLANVFADKGMKAVFTGHFHSNDISLFTSDKGNKIYDIETGTLAAYPFSYRFVDLYTDRMEVRTKNITSIPQHPNLAEEDRQRMQDLSEKLAAQKLKGLGFDLSPEITSQFVSILSQIFVMHAFGDEKMDDELKRSIEELASSMDMPMDTQDIQLDFPPADNNVDIIF